MTYIAGLNIADHDSSLAILDFSQGKTGDLTVYESERFTKEKQSGGFPLLALKAAALEFPKLKFTKHENIAFGSCGDGAQTFEQRFNTQSKYSSSLERESLSQFSSLSNPASNSYSHHLCHAMSALFFSPFNESIIIVADGMGSSGLAFKNCTNDLDGANTFAPTSDQHFESLSAYTQHGSELKLIEKIWTAPTTKFPHLSTGLGSFYGRISDYIFGTWKDSGKVMGLAAFGVSSRTLDANYENIEAQLFKEKIVYSSKIKFDSQAQIEFQESADLALLTQLFFEQTFLEFVTKLKSKFPSYKNLILTGGCALNCVNNSKILSTKLFENIFVPPCPNDEGIAIGAAYKKALDLKLTSFIPKEMNCISACLGSRSIEHELENEYLLRTTFKNFRIEKLKNPAVNAAELIAAGEILAWFQGRSECGPRALGNRSILCLPGLKGAKDYLNSQVKKREAFRPYGCSVAQEYIQNYVECSDSYPMPFMSFAPKVREQVKEVLSEVVHPDQTCRVQTVSQFQNPLFYNLLISLKDLTGHPVTLNTSLNKMGEPILETIEDAEQFLSTSPVKFMVIGNYLISRDPS